jgi:hypothetical protein
MLKHASKYKICPQPYIGFVYPVFQSVGGTGTENFSRNSEKFLASESKTRQSHLHFSIENDMLEYLPVNILPNLVA